MAVLVAFRMEMEFVFVQPRRNAGSCNNNNQCYGNNSNLDTACVSTFNGLTSAASATSDTITLCAGSLINFISYYFISYLVLFNLLKTIFKLNFF
jgi:hypothetical protein